MYDQVVLVDEFDTAHGTADKLEAHVEGWLHRAFSVFIFDQKGRLLLQQRNVRKYHSGGLWSNTCCSHPRPGEAVEAAARRRLLEEMGFECPLERAFGFVYHSEVGAGLYEHEYDHVFVGSFDGSVTPDPDEASDWDWVDVDALRTDIARHPERYTAWFKIALDRALSHAPVIRGRR